MRAFFYFFIALIFFNTANAAPTGNWSTPCSGGAGGSLGSVSTAGAAQSAFLDLHVFGFSDWVCTPTSSTGVVGGDCTSSNMQAVSPSCYNAGWGVSYLSQGYQQCGDGSFIPSGDTCAPDEYPLGEDGAPTCGGMQGADMVLDGLNSSTPLASQEFYDNGCEAHLYKCDSTSCTACYTGNGTKNGVEGRQWTKGGGFGTQARDVACPVNTNPTGYPKMCDQSSPNYNAQGGGCDTTESNLDLPTCEDEPEAPSCRFSWQNPDNEAFTPENPYQPPNAPIPPTPEETDSLDSGSNPSTPPVVDPDDATGGAGNNAGTIPSTGHTGGTGGSVPDEDPDGTIDWGSLPAIPESFYEREYPDGVGQIYADRLAEMQSTPFFEFLNTFIIPRRVSTCPEWLLDMSGMGFGVYDVSVPCEYWELAKVFVIIGALFLCRKIIFGG